MGGQNKGLIPFKGTPLIEHVMNRLDPSIKDRAISANDDLPRYQTLGYPVIADSLPGHLGPLCGMYSAMQFLNKEWLLVVPCDVPLLPTDYAQRMSAHDESAKAYVAFDGTRQHSGCCLLHQSLQADLLSHLQEKRLAVHRFLQEQHAQQVDFLDSAQAFANINTPEQLKKLEQQEALK